MTETGLGFPATRPALGRLAHIRAVLAARLWLQASPAWADGQPWWHSERRLRADHPAAGRREHVPDAEIHWPSIAGSPYAGQVWAIEVELTPKPIARTTRIMTGLLSPDAVRAGDLPDRPGRPARGHPRRGRAAARGPAPGGGPGAARRRVHPGAGAMSVWSWLKLTVCLWLLRKMIKAGGWLLLAALAIAAWPVTLVAARRVRGGVAAGLAAGAAAPDRGLGAAPGRDLGRHPGGAAGCLAAGRAGPGAGLGSAAGPTWPPPSLARAFVLLAPFAVPAGLALAALAWAWRIYAITTGLGGIMASAPITFDARQWKRQVRTAQGPDRGARRGPAAGPGRADPGRRHHPRHRPPLAPRLHHPGRRVRPAHGHRRRDRQSGRPT